VKRWTKWILFIILLIVSGEVIRDFPSLRGVLGGEGHNPLRAKAHISTLTSALRTYEMRSLVLPTTEQGLDALVSRPLLHPAPKRWRQLLLEPMMDPWGRPYHYMYPGVRSATGFDLWSLGRDGVVSKDDVCNWRDLE
jgi:general secretion pathway protein G